MLLPPVRTLVPALVATGVAVVTGSVVLLVGHHGRGATGGDDGAAGRSDPPSSVVDAPPVPTFERFSADVPGATVRAARTSNYTQAARGVDGDATIQAVVIHVAETSAAGAADLFRRAGKRASAHFEVAADGHVTQSVPVRDIAWHAGNWTVNERSVGVEHAGFTARGGFSEAEYRGSARLVAALVDRYAIAPDRRHVFGHDQVPDPDGTGVGGADHHTDPGPHWDWPRYLAYVRLDAADTPQVAARPVAGGGGAWAAAPTRAAQYDVFARVCGSGDVAGTVRWRGGHDAAVSGTSAGCRVQAWLGRVQLPAGEARVAVRGPGAVRGVRLVAVADASAPLPPSSVTATVDGDQVHLRWGVGTDDVGVAATELAVDSEPVRRLPAATTVHDVVAPACGTTRAVEVRSVDRAGNRSGGATLVVAGRCPD